MRRLLTPGELAWIALVPCTLVVVLAVVAVGPWIGTNFIASEGREFFPTAAANLVRPEPQEHGQFLVALTLVPLLSTVVLLGSRWRFALTSTTISRLVLSSQLAALALVICCLGAQRTHVYGGVFSFGEPFRRAYFTWTTLAAAATLTAVFAALLRSKRRNAVATWLTRETLTRRVVVAIGAALFAALWLSTAVNTDGSIGSNQANVITLPWSLEEAFAILNGLTPLVDFHSQYGQLLPWIPAATMLGAGTSLATYTITMATLSGLALLSAFAVLRRVTRSSLTALVLFAPFVATSFFMKVGPLDDRYGPSTLFSVWPVRYFGPMIALWLTARHIDGAAPRRPWILFTVAGLVVLNNTEFGLAAFVATVVALICVTPRRSRRGWVHLAVAAVAGVLLALLLVTLITLASSGHLPRFPLIIEFARTYGSGGFMMLPMPVLGLHVVLFLTVVACLVTAVIRATARPDRDPLLTGLLAWAGTFGLVIGAYFAGRSHPEVLIDLFGAWALALVLLTVVAVRAIASRAPGWPKLPELVVLAGFSVLCCSLAQLPTPWSQIERIGRETRPHVIDPPYGESFIADSVSPGEPVLIMGWLGHRIAYDLDVRNVSPYSSIEAMPTLAQFDTALDALRAAGGRRVFVWMPLMWPEALTSLEDAGFERARYDQSLDYLEMIDRSDR